MSGLDVQESMISTSDGVTLRVLESGRGADAVLCHGGPGLWDNLGDLASLLRDSARVVRYDQRGCGRSGGSQGPYTLETFVRDLDAVRASTGRERIVVGGHSWGATLALVYASTYPQHVAGLLYVSGTGIEWAHWKAQYRMERDRRLVSTRYGELSRLKQPSDTELRELRILGWSAEHADLATGLRRARALVDGGAVNARCNSALSAEVEAITAAEWVESCARVSASSLLIQGALDPRPIESLDSLARALPNTERVVLRDAGHYSWLDAAAQFRSTVERWLRTLWVAN